MTCDTDLIRASTSNNQTRHPVRRLAVSGAALVVWAASLAGCSLAFPISGMKADDTPTGSIDRAAAALSLSLDQEDLRRARAALAVALDPQGNGARSGWQNPQTGAHGAFTAAGPPFTDHDRVCRRYLGEVTPASAPERRLSGSACREGDGTWQMRADTNAKA